MSSLLQHIIPSAHMLFCTELRRIAYSQFDAIQDQLEAWRTQPRIFFDALLERAESTILSPGIPEHQKEEISCLNAVQSRLHIAHVRLSATLGSVCSRRRSLISTLKRAASVRSVVTGVGVFEHFDERGGRIRPSSSTRSRLTTNCSDDWPLWCWPSRSLTDGGMGSSLRF